VLSQPEKSKGDQLAEQVRELGDRMGKVETMVLKTGSSSQQPEVVVCPTCKVPFLSIGDFTGHFSDAHPRIVEKVVEKPVEKIVDKPTPLTPGTLPAMFDHILKCDEKGCEWVAQFKTDAAKKSLEKIGFVERGREAKPPEEQGYESLI